MRLSRASRGIDRGLCGFTVAIPPYCETLYRSRARRERQSSVLRERDDAPEIRARSTPRAGAGAGAGGGSGGTLLAWKRVILAEYISYSVDVAYAFSNYIRTS